MNIYSFPAIAAFVTNLSIAFIIFFGNPRSSVNRWITAFVMSFALWNISEIFILASGTEQGASLAAQILYRIIFIIPAIYVISAYHFPKSVTDLTKSVLFHVVVFLLPIIFLVSSFPHFHIKLISFPGSTTVYFYRIVVLPDFQSISLLTTFFVYLLWGSTIMIRKLQILRTTSEKRRGNLFLTGGSIFLLFSLLLFIVERFAEQTLYLYVSSTLLSSVVSIFFATAVLQGQMFKSSRTFRSGLAYSTASSIILAVYFLSVQAVTSGLLNYLKISSYAANALFVFVLVILIRPLELRIQRTLDNLLGRDLNRYRHNMVSFSRAISNYLPPSDFFRRVEFFLSRQFHIQNVLIFAKEDKTDAFVEWRGGEGSLRFEKNCYLLRQIREIKRPIEFYDLDRRNIDGQICSLLESKGIRLLIPLISADEVIGILAISIRRSGKEFNTDMIDALTIFANEVATAHQRNLTIERMREKEREELRVQHLSSLGQLTAGVAHEIRNPLNVMSVSAQTLLNRHLKVEQERQLKQFIVDEADRLNKILTDFLSLSKLREPKHEQVSLEDLFQRVKTAALPTAGEIEIQTTDGRSHTEFFTDRDLLHQLLFNLAINAVDAIKERCRTDSDFSCTKGVVSLTSDVRDGQIQISISDNGTGIAQENLEKVFEPFYTTKDTGTGLGLSISHNIAETLGGHIMVASKKEETVFTFVCKIKEAQG